MEPTAPPLIFLATISVEVAAPIEVGATIEGVRRIIPILGGSVRGPELNGTVLPGGADYQVLRSDTLTELEASYAIETREGERIYITNRGIRAGSSEDIAALVRGERVDPARIYFRSAPRLLSAGPKWQWLGSRMLLATGERLPGEVRLNLFVVG